MIFPVPVITIMQIIAVRPAIFYNLDPAQIPFTKTFVPDAIVPGDISTATFSITNPSSMLITDVEL